MGKEEESVETGAGQMRAGREDREANLGSEVWYLSSFQSASRYPGVGACQLQDLKRMD